jgi:hypothetical protein
MLFFLIYLLMSLVISIVMYTATKRSGKQIKGLIRFHCILFVVQTAALVYLNHVLRLNLW